jgi:hypothetical protein
MKNALGWVALALFFLFIAWFVIEVGKVSHGG